MHADILRVYQKAKQDELSPEEVNWLESLVQRHPWFAMPHQVLALHHQRRQSTIKERLLLRAAAYAPDRRLLRKYLEHALVHPRQERVPALAVTTPISHPEPPPVDPVQAESPLPENAALQHPVPPLQPQPETPESPTIAVEVSAETSIPEQIEAQDVAEPVEEIKAEETAISVAQDTPVQAASVPSVQVGINWGLNMRINLRAARYVRLGQRIREEMQAYAAAVETAQAAPMPEPPPVQPETPEYRQEIAAGEMEALQEPIPAQEQAPIQSETLTAAEEILAEPAAEVLEIQPETPEILAEPAAEAVEPVEAQPLSPELPQETDLPEPEADPVFMTPEPEAGPETVEIMAPPAAEAVEPTPQSQTYEIGAFSSFSFLDETAEAEPQVPPVAESGEGTALLVEAPGRVLEITLTPEQIQKYFQGRSLRQAQPEPPAQEPVHIEPTLDFWFHEEIAAAESPSHDGETEEERHGLPSPETTPLLHGSLLDQHHKNRKSYVDALMERFLDVEPGLTRPDEYALQSTGNLAKKSVEEDEDLVTETLARIHAAQGNLSRAIKIYQKLSLLFPDKKDYFAIQISKLKQ